MRKTSSPSDSCRFSPRKASRKSLTKHYLSTSNAFLLINLFFSPSRKPLINLAQRVNERPRYSGSLNLLPSKAKLLCVLFFCSRYYKQQNKNSPSVKRFSKETQEGGERKSQIIFLFLLLLPLNKRKKNNISADILYGSMAFRSDI